jgi:hypothetical protein
VVTLSQDAQNPDPRTYREAARRARHEHEEGLLNGQGVLRDGMKWARIPRIRTANTATHGAEAHQTHQTDQRARATEEREPEAERIYLVQDNLNTHTACALYPGPVGVPSYPQARQLAQPS